MPHSIRRLAGAGAILAFSQIVGMAALLFCFSTIQHTFSKEENGTFFWVQQISGFAFLIVAEMGMNSIAIRLCVESWDDFNAQNRIISTFFKLRLLLWFLASSALWAFTWFTEPKISAVVVLYTVYLMIAARGTLIRSVLETRRRSLNLQLVPALTGLLDLVLITIFVLVDRENLTPFRVVIWFCLAAFPGFFILLIIDGQWKLLAQRFDTRLAKRLLYESMPIFLSLCLMQIQDKSDTFALNFFHGRDLLGVYSAVTRIIAPCVGLLMIISIVIAPLITHLLTSDPARCRIYVVEGLKITLLAATACAVSIDSVAEGIIWVTAGKQYLPFSAEFTLGAWALVPSMCVAYLLAILTALGQQRTLLPMMIALCLSAVMGNALFTSTFGVIGALSARIFATILAAGIGLVIVHKFMKNNVLQDFLMRFGIFTVLMILSLWGALAITPQLSLPLPVAIVFRTIVLIVVFMLGCLGTGLVRKEDIALMRSLVKAPPAL